MAQMGREDAKIRSECEPIAVQELIRMDSQTILRFNDALLTVLKSIPDVYLLSKDDIEQLRNDTILITIRKFQEGTELFDDSSVLGFARGIAWKLLANRV